MKTQVKPTVMGTPVATAPEAQIPAVVSPKVLKNNRLAILDNPKVPPMAAEMVKQWGDLTQVRSALDVIRFGADVEKQIEAFYASMNQQAGKMETHTFLAVANALMEGAESQDDALAKIEKEAGEQFNRPFLIWLTSLVSSKWADKMDRQRLPEISAAISSKFKDGGQRLSEWIDAIKLKTEDACRSQIESIKRWELALDAGKEHEIALAATISAGYQIVDQARAVMNSLPSLDKKQHIEKIEMLEQRLGFIGALYADAPGRMIRSQAGLEAARNSLATTISSAQMFYIQLRQSGFDLTQAYTTRALQLGNQHLQKVAGKLQARGTAVLSEVAIHSVTMQADAAKASADLNMSLATATKKLVDDLKVADEAAKRQIAESSNLLVQGQQKMIELREQLNTN